MSIHKKIKAHIRAHLEKRHQHHHNMDNQTPNTSTGPKFFQGKVKIVYTLIFLVVLLIAGAGIFFYNSRQSGLKQTQDTTPQFEKTLESVVSTKGQFKPDQKIIQIGEETIYGSDLNNILYTFFNSDIASPASSLKPLEDKLLAKTQEQSIILQEGKKAGFITLIPTTFNSPNKDLLARNTLIASAEAKLKERFISKISGETVSIWFHNASWPAPKIGYDQAKVIAQGKIESIYADLKAGKITFLQARDRIVSDTSIAAIDPSYKTNTYYSWTDRDTTWPLFSDPAINKVAWQLKSGEMSNILTAQELGKNNLPYEALFVIIKINKKVDNGFGNFNDWLTAKRKQYEIKLF